MEALDQMAKDGIALDYLRVRGFPFGEDVRAFVEQHDVTFVVEQNRDGQLRTLLMLETGVAIDQARIGPLLRRLPDERASRRRGREGEAGEGGMTYIAKPKVHHPSLQKNAIGLTRRDYEGAITTLCAGCGHDSITAAIIQAFWELSIPPHTVAKLSGIGCSSKTPAYFLREAHGFNSVHGRMPAIATGAGAANGALTMIGVSGDGDSLSIGLGQLSPRHPPQRQHALHAREQRRLRAHQGAVLRLGRSRLDEQEGRGQHRWRPSTACCWRSRSGRRSSPAASRATRASWCRCIKAGLAHKGFAFIDVISPCVTFNDHEGSTKSYAYTREHQVEVVHADFVPPRDEITSDQDAGTVKSVLLHDGSWVTLHKVAEDYDPTDRDRAYAYIRERQKAGEVLTGLLYISPDSRDMVAQNELVDAPLYNLPYEQLCPGTPSCRGCRRVSGRDRDGAARSSDLVMS